MRQSQTKGNDMKM